MATMVLWGFVQFFVGYFFNPLAAEHHLLYRLFLFLLILLLSALY